jgi:hypothetical protein
MKNNNQLATAISLVSLGLSSAAWSANGELFGIDYRKRRKPV